MASVSRSVKTVGLLFAVIVTLSACGSSDKEERDMANIAKRIAVMEANRKPVPDPSLTDYKAEVPEPAANIDWAFNGGNATHSVGNLALRPVVESLWSSGIGAGSDGDYRLLASPVVSENVVYAMDARGRISATNALEGDRLWRVETAPRGSDDAIGGGVAVVGKVLYAGTGFGEVLAMRAEDGAVIWRRMVGKPIRSAPTVSDNRVFVITIENETHCIDAKTGIVQWKHSGIAESAALMGASSPAVHGDTVVVAYSSGELFGLRAQNGRVVWGEVLAVPTRVGALPAIADIRGLPVIDGGRVYAISHSGRMVSLDERTGARAWEADLGGVSTPLVVGNMVYVVTINNDLVGLSRSSGRIVWTTELQKNKRAGDTDSKPIQWWGPIMAGGRLWLTSTLGHLVAYAPDTGYALYEKEVGDAYFMAPIVVGGTMYLMGDNGKIQAFK